MIRITGDHEYTPWLKNSPSEKELQRLTITELLILCRYKTRRISFKRHLIQYLLQFEKL